MDRLRGLADDLKVGVLFATRIPLPRAAPVEGADIARASWTLPVVGLLVGASGALCYWIAFRLGLPALVDAGLAVAATMLVTGGLHEDGLADTLDGFGAAADRERKLEIMRDSRIGTYGAAALMLSLLLRIAALASLGAPVSVAAALLVAHAGARAALPVFMRMVPPARSDGLAADAGRPSRATAGGAALIGMLAAILALGVMRAIVAIVVLTAILGLMRRLCVRQIGGQTGDVVGATEQIGEIALMLIAAAA